jgi:tetratricopeptide (TPR) repeat protein
MEDLSEIMARADAHLAEAAWGAAAVSYAHGAAIAGRAGDRPTAGLAWERAGECWRRDDRPSSAAQALELAVSHAGEASAGASARVKLAAVLGELGQSEVSTRLCEAALGGDPDPTTRAIALDTWVDSLIGLGRREEARVRLDELGRVAVGGLGIARLFREAQLARLFGRLDDATAALGEALTTLGDAPGAQIGVAAAEA